MFVLNFYVKKSSSKDVNANAHADHGGLRPGNVVRGTSSDRLHRN